MNDLSEYALAKAQAWKALVKYVYSKAGLFATSPPSDVVRKIAAIKEAQSEGMTQDEIIAAGQTEILSRAARNRRNSSGPQRVLSWRVSRSLADAVMSSDASPDAEEALVTRLVRVCHLKTSDDLFEFLLSVFADVDDKELKHLAGEADVKQKARKTSVAKQ